MINLPAVRKQKARRHAFWSNLPSCIGYVVQEIVTSPLKRPREWLIAQIEERMEVSGMLVLIDSDDAIDRARIHAGITEALEKLTAWAPRMRRRINAEVRQILIEPSTTARYIHPGTIVLPLHAFHHTDTDAVASYIVHEAVHERIETRGIRYWPHLRARIERCCLREQLAFLASRQRTDLVSHFEQYLLRRWSETQPK